MIVWRSLTPRRRALRRWPSRSVGSVPPALAVQKPRFSARSRIASMVAQPTPRPVVPLFVRQRPWRRLRRHP